MKLISVPGSWAHKLFVEQASDDMNTTVEYHLFHNLILFFCYCFDIVTDANIFKGPVLLIKRFLSPVTFRTSPFVTSIYFCCGPVLGMDVWVAMFALLHGSYLSNWGVKKYRDYTTSPSRL